jgi:hypothetical protein
MTSQRFFQRLSEADFSLYRTGGLAPPAYFYQPFGLRQSRERQNGFENELRISDIALHSSLTLRIPSQRSVSRRSTQSEADSEWVAETLVA